ncbi:NAD-dependent epimerase/dehydratase family protein [Amycolatopsis acidicola]|uniref:NAD-dependent epimerase/dehydratase family protein n=1 Tax=Amycolatopsis acidicola TaxID=2596893 RepID=A0A5N0V535_9PSEU|nr:NAD-dependent epimerase/dehydratase family protein [Amycolatopsis acidicola]KAA9160914.1 NAD-dependent epimerase/dehydratase family protein [Amycolatopsis acidicola]
MRCVVTGGAGFIGSYLTEHLLGRGHEVTVLDDFSTGSVRNLTGVAGNPRLRVVTGSVCDAETVAACVAGADAVYHLAAAVGVFTILDRTLGSLRTNLTGTETVLTEAGRAGARVLVASTSEVYGKNTKPGLREDDDRVLGSPLKNRWSYAEAKALDETFAHLHAVEHGLRMVIVRLFNTVGPRQSGRYGMVVPRFVDQALAGEPLTVFGTGRQSRCFCHVLDIVPALVMLLEDESAHGTVYNLGNPEPVTIEQLAQAVLTRTGSAAGIVHVPYAEAYGPGYEDMERRIPDCTRAFQAIGFRPARRLADILDSVLAERRAAVVNR